MIFKHDYITIFWCFAGVLARSPLQPNRWVEDLREVPKAKSLHARTMQREAPGSSKVQQVIMVLTSMSNAEVDDFRDCAAV